MVPVIVVLVVLTDDVVLDDDVELVAVSVRLVDVIVMSNTGQIAVTVALSVVFSLHSPSVGSKVDL